ncbi:hypothetical protein V5O48_006339 [Marasmius crinis-equi]|uniref:glucan 1,3-beta-glucosidase n=1 Tax=Marasmius crinis-equi TaxID=585013 RepID=A0ABR3FK61_9AGAR
MSQNGASAAAPYNPVPLDEHPGTPREASFTDSPRSVPHTPLPSENARFLGHDPATVRDSYASSGFNQPYTDNDTSSGQFLNHDDDRAPGQKRETLGYGDVSEKTGSGAARRRKPLILGLAALAVVILIIVIVVPVYFTVIKKDDDSSSSGSSSGSGGSDGGSGGDGGKDGGKPGTVAAVTGGDGTEVTLEDGSKFKYENPHGGYWYYDVNDPFNNGARAQSWSPALNETFKYGIDKIRGYGSRLFSLLTLFTNLKRRSDLSGSILEDGLSWNPCPAPFEKYQPAAVDEYTLHQAMAADSANGGLDQIEEHYKTFITEKDFADIAAAGLNYIRLPVPYWAVETHPTEPFLPKVAWKYVLKAIQWARKYGIRINLDLHSVPGSQNDWNHSGRRGDVNFLRGPMGYANAQRTLDIIRVMAEFVAQPQYRDVVTMFGPLNEPRGNGLIPKDSIASFYAQAYKIIREASGDGQGPWISFHDAMLSKAEWAGFLPNGFRRSIDSHPYTAFSDQQSDASWSANMGTPCNWGKEFNESMAAFGLSSAGEWSNAVNDCGLWLNGIPEGTRYDGTYTPSKTTAVGSCDKWTDWEKYSDATKDEIMKFAMASMDGLQNWFFWTWKIGASSKSNKVESPAWSYSLGWKNGWMPKDPRQADGACGNTSPFTGTITDGSGQVALGQYPWPPASITMAGDTPTNLPHYTNTGSIPTLTPATYTVSGAKPTKTVDMGSGWNNANDKTGYVAEIQGCKYPDAWVGSATVDSPWCAAAKRDVESPARPTPAYSI